MDSNLEHDDIYVLMMDALDGELTVAERHELEAHLRARPEYLRLWEALHAIDTLLRQTPALSPAADFAQRTLASLPNKRLRLLAVSLVYAMLLVGGLLPLLLGVLTVSSLRPLVSQPALIEGLWRSVEKILQVTGTIVGALLSGMGEFVLQQPAVLGWLLVLAGIVSLWSGVYRQLVAQSNRAW